MAKISDTRQKPLSSDRASKIVGTHLHLRKLFGHERPERGLTLRRTK